MYFVRGDSRFCIMLSTRYTICTHRPMSLNYGNSLFVQYLFQIHAYSWKNWHSVPQETTWRKGNTFRDSHQILPTRRIYTIGNASVSSCPHTTVQRCQMKNCRRSLWSVPRRFTATSTGGSRNPIHYFSHILTATKWAYDTTHCKFLAVVYFTMLLRPNYNGSYFTI